MPRSADHTRAVPSKEDVTIRLPSGENEAERGFVPDGVAADQRAALPMSALPDGWQDTGRNQPCPCGSGKKFKHCHGAFA